MEGPYYHGPKYCSNQGAHLCPRCGRPRVPKDHYEPMDDFIAGEPCPPVRRTPKSHVMRRLLESIAHEELALAHVVNSEAMKLQKVTKCVIGPFMPDEVVEIQRSMSDVLEKLAKKEDLLLRKLRLILAYDCNREPCPEPEE